MNDAYFLAAQRYAVQVSDTTMLNRNYEANNKKLQHNILSSFAFTRIIGIKM